MYIDSGDSLAQKTGSRKLIKKRSTFCPISKSASSLDYEFLVSSFKIFEANQNLLPFIQHFQERQNLFMSAINSIFSQDYSLDTFALLYEQFGLFATEKGFTYKEYAPHALEVYLTGDFNQWNPTQYPLVNDGTGIWTLNLNNGEQIPHLSKVAAFVRTSKNQHVFRVPIGAKYITKLEGKENGSVCEVFWNPPEKFIFENIRPHKPRVFKIYRAEIGKASADKKSLTYDQFTEKELKRIKELGYNTLLLVGIQEHDFRGNSYSVSNPFAINSNAGDPNQLKSLVDKAHELGLYVTMDIVQTHASPDQGFNEWDGSHFSYFIEGEEGIHPSGGRLFNFGKIETQRLLLSNLGYFMNEYKIDGFRFHDIPSIIYKNHGRKNIGGKLEDYFTENASIDGLAYLMLANETVHKINSNAVTFAEDDTNYPSLCYPLDQGGIGFDYRISLKPADKLPEVLNSSTANIPNEVISLLNERFPEEKTISSLCYKFSDILLQGIRGQIAELQNQAVQRSLSLHKIARLITLSYGGDSYLNRYGNEFGSSEEYLQIDLLQLSPYRELNDFDGSLLQLEEKYQILSMNERIVTLKSQNLLAFERAELIFCFNFSDSPVTQVKIGTKWNSDHNLIFSTDSAAFGGLERITWKSAKVYNEIVTDAAVRPFHLKLDIPAFTAVVLQPIETE